MAVTFDTALRVLGSSVGDEIRRRVTVDARVRRVEARLDELLPLAQGDHRLQFGSSKRVDVTRLRSDEDERLSSGQRCQLVRLRNLENEHLYCVSGGGSSYLLHESSLPPAEGDLPPALVLDELYLDPSSSGPAHFLLADLGLWLVGIGLAALAFLGSTSVIVLFFRTSAQLVHRSRRKSLRQRHGRLQHLLVETSESGSFHGTHVEAWVVVQVLQLVAVLARVVWV